MSTKIVFMLMALFCTALALVLVVVGFITVNKGFVIEGMVSGWIALLLMIIEGALDEP